MGRNIKNQRDGQVVHFCGGWLIWYDVGFAHSHPTRRYLERTTYKDIFARDHRHKAVTGAAVVGVPTAK